MEKSQVKKGKAFFLAFEQGSPYFHVTLGPTPDTEMKEAKEETLPQDLCPSLPRLAAGVPGSPRCP